MRKNRLVPGQRRGYFVGPPDLAVEVRSPGDSRRELAAKAADWLAHGCPCVWIIDGGDRTVTVHSAGVPSVTLGGTVVLDGGDMLPGFELPLGDLFAE